MLRSTIACLAAGLALSGCAATFAGEEPQHLGRGDGIRDGYVTAESRYGTATVSGPVRRGARGRLEVGLPGGTWIECVRSCSETLRRETVDFWENHGNGNSNNSGSDGPGYFRWTW